MTACAPGAPATDAVTIRAASSHASDPHASSIVTAPADPARTRSDSLAIIRAAAALAIKVVDLYPIAQGRTGVYRATIHTHSPHDGFPAGPSRCAARVSTSADAITSPRQVHRAVHQLRHDGAPVAAPCHRDIVTTPHGEVGFWEWLEQTLVTPYEWGHLTAALHRCDHRITGVRPYHPATVFAPRIRRARDLTGTRGHPLFGAHTLVRSFETALDVAVDRALAAAATEPPALVHGDNHPGNVMRFTTGPVLNDFERLVRGPAALDVAAVVLGLQHFGYPRHVGEEFLTGYGLPAPSLDAAQPYARIRELSGIVIAMIHAGDSPEMEQQMRIRTAAIANAGDGQRWTFVGNPDAMRLAGLAEPGRVDPAEPEPGSRSMSASGEDRSQW